MAGLSTTIKLNVTEILDEVKKQIFSQYEPYKRNVEDFIYDLIESIVDTWKFEEKFGEKFRNRELKFYVAGGALTSSFCKTEINDYDIYFYDEDTFNLFKEVIEYHSASVIAKTERAITFNRSGQSFQLIRLFGTPSETFDKFDFTINMCALDFVYNYDKNELTSSFDMSQKFMLDNMSKSLVFNPNTIYPINSLFRVKKYQDRGYKINTLEMMKIALRISQMEIKTVGDIKNQVTGLSSDIMKELSLKLDKLEDSVVIEDPIKFIQDVYDDLINKDEFNKGVPAPTPVEPKPEELTVVPCFDVNAILD